MDDLASTNRLAASTFLTTDPGELHADMNLDNTFSGNHSFHSEEELMARLMAASIVTTYEPQDNNLMSTLPLGKSKPIVSPFQGSMRTRAGGAGPGPLPVRNLFVKQPFPLFDFTSVLARPRAPAPTDNGGEEGEAGVGETNTGQHQATSASADVRRLKAQLAILIANMDYDYDNDDDEDGASGDNVELVNKLRGSQSQRAKKEAKPSPAAAPASARRPAASPSPSLNPLRPRQQRRRPSQPRGDSPGQRGVRGSPHGRQDELQQRSAQQGRAGRASDAIVRRVNFAGHGSRPSTGSPEPASRPLKRTLSADMKSDVRLLRALEKHSSHTQQHREESEEDQMGSHSQHFSCRKLPRSHSEHSSENVHSYRRKKNRRSSLEKKLTERGHDPNDTHFLSPHALARDISSRVDRLLKLNRDRVDALPPMLRSGTPLLPPLPTTR